MAVGQDTIGTAQDLATVSANAVGPDWSHISRLIDEWHPYALVVGLPIQLDGQEGSAARQVRKFGDALRDRYNLDVHFVDERFTTEAADRALRSADLPERRARSMRDRIAAQYILQTFLEQQSRSGLESD